MWRICIWIKLGLKGSKGHVTILLSILCGSHNYLVPIHIMILRPRRPKICFLKRGKVVKLQPKNTCYQIVSETLWIVNCIARWIKVFLLRVTKVFYKSRDLFCLISYSFLHLCIISRPFPFPRFNFKTLNVNDHLQVTCPINDGTWIKAAV